MYERPRVNLKLNKVQLFNNNKVEKYLQKQTDSNLLTTWLTVLKIRIQNPKK